ncbi:MAG: leucine-rich repeat domain-containing protein [Candidatus Paceibacterota bacterium]
MEDITTSDEVPMSSLWEIWKASLRTSRKWTRINQWLASERVNRYFSPPHQVLRLDLSRCCLKGHVPSQLGHLSLLQELALDNNELTSLPPEIGHLSLLRELRLDHNDLTRLPPEIGRLSFLQWLPLDHNELRSLPPEIGRLSSLERLTLDGNELRSLPPEIGRISSLQGLTLDDNELTSLPPEIGHLSSLQWLTLGSNRLTSLPPEIGRLSSLAYLNLGHNQLTSLPPEMSRLSSLEQLHLRSNQLVSYPSASFPPTAESLASLRLISLVDNCLITLPPPSLISSCVKIYTDTQRLPTTLDAFAFDTAVDDDSCSCSSSSSSSSSTTQEEAIEFALRFYTNDTEGETDRDTTASSSGCIHIANRERLARRWPYFQRLLDADLSEARSGHVDLSAYFSLRLGQCLVDYFDGEPVHVSSLSTQDCRDLVEHADYFELTSDILLHAFCTTKLASLSRNGIAGEEDKGEA